MTALAFTVPGEPVAFARTRVNRGGALFTPPKQRAWMRDCAAVAALAMRGRAPFAGAVHLAVTAVYAHPASWSAARRAATRFKTSTPDADNIAKLAADSLKGIAWRDDAQAARVTVEKVYGAEPRVEVAISAL